MAKNKPQSQFSGSGPVRAVIKSVQQALEVPIVENEVLEKIRSGYQALSREEKSAFFVSLLHTVEVPAETALPLLAQAADASADPAAWRDLLVRIRAAVESPRWRLLRHFVTLPGGLKFLLDLRADVLSAHRQGASDLKPLDSDLVRLFESWFQPGFLTLKEITLDSPYRQIEIIRDRDMVHPMTSLEEVAHRLGRDRRCFALYHHVMPDEPVVFIEAFLAKGLVRSIQKIIGPGREEGAINGRKDTAVFYSINNTQNGLSGLGLGKLLIFQVVEHLNRDVPEIRNFCTLSPMPGFWRRYLLPILEGKGSGFKLKTEELTRFFDKNVRGLLEAEYATQGGKAGADLASVLLKVFSSAGWAEKPELVAALARPLSRLGYYYLAEEKAGDGRPLDPVANFHLGNGATLAPGDVNFGANWSPKGIERSLSLMVNYVYSQSWRQQIRSSLSRLGGWLPGLSWPWTGRQQ